MVRTRQRSRKRIITAALLSLGLFAAACGKKNGGDSTDATTVLTETTASSGDTEPSVAVETTVAEGTIPPETTPADVPVLGGTLIVSGEAEVTSPWTPAAMQCDTYCFQRARTFFDSVAAIGDDLKVHPVLAEAITPNDDYTEWTITVREGITFTDGTPVNADALIKNLQLSGTGLLISAALLDVAKVPSAADPAKNELKIEKLDEMSFTIFTGLNGDPAQPLPWPGFDVYLTGQWGLIASPAWLDAVAADPALAAMPIGSGPFIVESFAPRDKLVVKRNPNYWLKDANGNQLPYLDGAEFRVIEDSEIEADALRSGDIDIFSTSAALVVADFREQADEFPMREQSDFTETDYILIDHDKPGPLQDVRVRCALSKAIDREEYVEALSNGISTPANGVFSPGQEGYLEDNGFDITQDIEGAKALIDEYEAETGTQVAINYGTTTSQINAQRAELMKGYWNAIGVDFEYQQVPQDSFITSALFGAENFFAFAWRQHAGLTIDTQNYWWHSRSASPDGALSLNFARIRDDVVDENLDIARSDPDPAARKAAAEAVNRRMAEQCHQIPFVYTVWGTPHKPSVMGLGDGVLPDGAKARDGAGFSGQFWMHNVWINPEA